MVKTLFCAIEHGIVRPSDDVPGTMSELRAVRFDRSGEPIYETIGPLVRALAKLSLTNDIVREVEQRSRTSAVQDLVGQPVAVSEDSLRQCATRRTFTPLAFALYRETVAVLSVCSGLHTGPSPDEGVLPRNQAICAGLLVRIAKFMSAVASLASQSSDHGDVVLALNRSIAESASNLRFLIGKNEERVYEQFARSSLSPEREAYDVVQKNIAERGGSAWAIERRMLRSIDRVCRLTGVDISEVPPKSGPWGGGLRNRLIFLKEDRQYAFQQRIASHAVHGNWVDLLLHHLTTVDNGFRPDPHSLPVDTRLLLPPCTIALEASLAYVTAFFPPMPELVQLAKRIEDLKRRIVTVDGAHEAWLSEQKPDNS